MISPREKKTRISLCLLVVFPSDLTHLVSDKVMRFLFVDHGSMRSGMRLANSDQISVLPGSNDVQVKCSIV